MKTLKPSPISPGGSPVAIIEKSANHRPMNSPTSRAFTLTEVLVAIGIIVSLAALLFPAVGKMRDKAAMTTDLNNLKQIGQGLAAFAGENNGKIPNESVPVPGTATAADQPDRESFMEAVDRMMTPDKKFSSISIYNWQRRKVWYSKAYAKMPPGQSYPSSQYYWGTAWGMNAFLWNNDSPLDGENAFNGNLNRAPNLSKLVLVGEKNRNARLDFDPRITPTFQADVDRNYRVSRDGKAYYLFADYHIELIEGDQSTIAHPEYKTYSPTNRLYYAW